MKISKQRLQQIIEEEAIKVSKEHQLDEGWKDLALAAGLALAPGMAQASQPADLAPSSDVPTQQVQMEQADYTGTVKDGDGNHWSAEQVEKTLSALKNLRDKLEVDYEITDGVTLDNVITKIEAAANASTNDEAGDVSGGTFGPVAQTALERYNSDGPQGHDSKKSKEVEGDAQSKADLNGDGTVSPLELMRYQQNQRNKNITKESLLKLVREELVNALKGV